MAYTKLSDFDNILNTVTNSKLYIPVLLLCNQLVSVFFLYFLYFLIHILWKVLIL